MVEPAAGRTSLSEHARVPATLTAPGAALFWTLAALTGIAAGLGAAALSLLLGLVQNRAWGTGPGEDLLAAATGAGDLRRITLLAAAGAVTGIGQLLLTRLSSGNGIDITAAIWFTAGRLPVIRTLGSAVLSVVIVALGTSLGREGAPKQVGAVAADLLSSWGRLTDEQRRLLVACGAGAGMAAAYGVPLGGALFALEVVRGALALRLVLPALTTSLLACATAALIVPSGLTYAIPAVDGGASAMAFALLTGPLFGVLSVGCVRAVAWVDRNKPKGWLRVALPVVTLTGVGLLSIPFPQVLGNGKDVTELAFTGAVAVPLLAALILAKPLAVMLCYGAGAPGGLFTPTLATGALLGGLIGHGWLLLWPGGDPGLFAVLGAASLLAATTQGPVSATVLMMELTGRDRSFIAPLLLAVIAATLVARTIEQRSIYEARLSDDAVAERLRERDPAPGGAREER